VSRMTSTETGTHQLTANLRIDGEDVQIRGEGNGAVSAFIDALASLGIVVQVLDYSEHAMTAGGTAKAAAYVECEIGDGETSQILWGVGIDPDIAQASLNAVVNAVNRSRRQTLDRES
ncbi:MAG TPA: 2-isopropylmalate synthase, partial [Cutibacterium acnes]|nr:2-isopropylmalate synthase [Cutibacterium acnes]